MLTQPLLGGQIDCIGLGVGVGLAAGGAEEGFGHGERHEDRGREALGRLGCLLGGQFDDGVFVLRQAADCRRRIGVGDPLG